MKNKKGSGSNLADRRRVLGILIGGALTTKTLPERWSRPVIDSVVLPAHAQTSPDVSSGPRFQFACRLVGPGTIAAGGGMADVRLTISPAPGPGISILAMGSCNGNLVFNVTQMFDFSSGEVVVTVGPTPGPPTCEAGDVLTVQLSAPDLDADSVTCRLDVV